MESISTIIAAWVGATTGLLALCLEFYKWKSSGPDLHLTVHPSVHITGLQPPGDDTYTKVVVENRGNKPTTLDYLQYSHYATEKDYKKSKIFASLLMPHVLTNDPLPHFLEPGAVWKGKHIQTEDFESTMQSGVLECRLKSSIGKKYVATIVKFSKLPEMSVHP